MSGVAQDAVAAVPLDSNMEGLERRLLELRAEIDAILMQLAGQKAPAESELPAAPVPQAQEAGAPMPEAAHAEASLDAGEQEQAAPEADVTADADVRLAQDVDTDTPDQPSAAQPMPADAPIAELPSADEASELSSTENEASDDLTLIASIDANPVSEDAPAPTTTDATVPGTPAQGEPAADVVEVSTAAAPMETVAAEETPAAAPTADEGQQATAEVPSLPVVSDIPVTTTADAEARVINFEPRQRKQRGTFVATGAAPVRRGRKVATRIAAGIVALIAAGTALVVSDRTAVGSTLSLPWTSPLPSYLPSRANWPFLGQFKNSEQSRVAGDRDEAANAALAVAHEALLARYREVWPMSP